MDEVEQKKRGRPPKQQPETPAKNRYMNISKAILNTSAGPIRRNEFVKLDQSEVDQYFADKLRKL